MSDQLPQTTEKPLPPPPPPEVAVAITEETVTPEEVLEAMRRQGLIKVSRETVKDLAKIGIHLKGAGTLKVQRGIALVTQQRLDEAMMLLLEQMRPKETTSKAGNKTLKGRKVAELVALSSGLAQLSKSLNESQRLSVEVEDLVTAAGGGLAEAPAAPTASFAPRSKVGPAGNTAILAQPGSTVHVHQTPPDKPKD